MAFNGIAYSFSYRPDSRLAYFLVGRDARSQYCPFLRPAEVAKLYGGHGPLRRSFAASAHSMRWNARRNGSTAPRATRKWSEERPC